MATTPDTAPEQPPRQFSSPNEELEYLRAQVAEKERQLAEAGHTPERDATAYEAVQTYQETPPEQVLHEDHQLSENEVEAIVLDLPPDQDDEVVQELLGVVHEKGVRNALMVAQRLDNAHVQDDLHRALVQYVARGYDAPDLNEKNPLWRSLTMTLFEVTLPEPSEEDEQRSLEDVVQVMEQFYYGMLTMDDAVKAKSQKHFTLELAVSAEREDITFYMAVPQEKEDLFEKQLLSMFPKARAHHVPEDYNIFLHNGHTAIAFAHYNHDPILPLKDYREFEQDPLAVLINALTNLAPVGEGAAIQFVVQPANARYEKRYKKVLEKLQKGMNLHEALRETPEGIGGEVVKTFRDLMKSEKKKTPEQEQTERENKMVDEAVVEEVRKKLETAIPAVNIRIVACAGDAARASAILADIQNAFNQYYSTNGNGLQFDIQRGKAATELAKKFTFREHIPKTAQAVSVRELTSLMHFPTHAIQATPQLKRARAAVAPAPVGLPQNGTQLGVNEFRGQSTKVFLTPEDRLRHLYVIGQTGTGKSKFLLSLIKQDIENGEGVCFIDPHGEDIELVLQNIPEHRFKDVIYFDPADTKNVLGLNMLEYDTRFPEQKTFVINELFSIFQKLYSGTPESMGPAFEQYFRNATALVLEDPATGSTMLDISRVLADAKYRAVKLSRSQNPVVNQFWNEIATKAQGEASLQNIVPYITNKFDIFTANDIMRPIIAQQKSSFNMREVMDTKKILLVNLSKGKLGDINANLLGMVIVGKALMAALSRVDALASDLPPFYFYIDEFQNITTNSISAILSEARKYKLSLNVAHQFIAQLDDGIRDAVFGNIGTIAAFRVGYEDADYLENQFRPVFETQDIMNIENRHAYIRLLANGVPQKPFSFKTLNYNGASAERSAHIKQLSAQNYGRSKEEVDKEVRMRYSIG